MQRIGQIIGVEPANGFTKVCSMGTLACYPNRMKKVIRKNQVAFNEANETIYTSYDEELKPTGDFTLNAKGFTSGGRNNNRYSTKEYLFETLVAITKVKVADNVVLVVGIPARDYHNKDFHEMIKKNLERRHVIGVNGQQMIIDIKKVIVALEPLGTLIDFIYDGNGNVVNNRNDFSYLIVDIGHGTTDILGTEKGIVPSVINGVDVGCTDILNVALELINDRYSSTSKNFNANDLSMDLLREKKIILKKYMDEPLDVTREFEEAKELVANEIRTVLFDKLGINFNDYSRVIYTGGGSLALEKYLMVSDNIRIYPNPQKANVKGYVKFANLKGYTN